MACRLNGVVGVVDDQGSRFRHRRFTTVRNYPRLEMFRPRHAEPVSDETGAANGDEAELIHVGSMSRERGSIFPPG